MNDEKFSRARITLMLWYVLFVFIILTAFSGVLYTTETGNFARVVLERNFGNRPPRVLSLEEIHELQEQVIALRKAFIVNLIMIDGIILLVGGGLGYILAGKTLEPIKKTYKQQKEFLANASHEFRTPLAAIQTASEVVLRSPSKTKEDYKKVLEQTLQESKRLSVIADELLVLSRVDAGIAKLQMVQCNISKVIDEALSEVQPLVEAKDLKLVRKIHPQVLLDADPDRLKQLILIFLDNAIKFTPAKGTITLSLEKKPKVQLMISDTGVGIEKKDLDHIFERFYQADKARGGGSSGLGLSIAHWIATAHSATISVKSRVRKGSSFIVQFS